MIFYKNWISRREADSTHKANTSLLYHVSRQTAELER